MEGATKPLPNFDIFPSRQSPTTKQGAPIHEGSAVDGFPGIKQLPVPPPNQRLWWGHSGRDLVTATNIFQCG
ncbi:hypothetical protein SD81_017135 [Tolypothrix campylonemoides VB511288]|nr:hypothetical protein SD81_017135 [Tolypothrix campylonemoides VB511288]